MTRRLLVAAGLVALPLALLLAAEPPALPKDTLPETLPLDTLPLGLGDRQVPKDNPLTAKRVALGRKLFFDPVLSADNTVACASCHRPELGFAGEGAKAKGIGGKEGPRRAPTLLNRGLGTAFFWDGRARSLEEQALEPIENPLELGSKVSDAVAKLKADAGYAKQFADAFDDGVSAGNLAKALAGFERTLVRGDSPVDRFRLKGDQKAMTATERHGFWLYESKASCWKCHGGSNFTDDGFHNTGVSWGDSDLGRHAVTKKDADRGRFKTPTLRGVKLRPPYMHDGSLGTLEEVVEFYNRGGGKNPHLDPEMKPLDLDENDRKALVAFLKSL
jgi:cytochrome c peroxidase